MIGSVCVKYYINQNTPGVKKVAAKNLKKAMVEMMWNRNGQPRPTAVDRIKIFYNDDQAVQHYHCLPTVKL